MVSEPVSDPGFIDIVSGDGQHGRFGVVDIKGIGFPSHVIEIEEHDKRRPRGSLVAVWQGVVPGQPAHQHGGFVSQVGIELLVGEAGPWRVEGRISQVSTTRFGHHVGFYPG